MGKLNLYTKIFINQLKGGKKKVLVALSGGVDSSVAALILKQQGYDVFGIYLRLHENYQEGEAAARRVADVLGIKFYPVSAADTFRAEVIDYYLENYAANRTPNPCVVCNRAVKFSGLFNLMKTLGGDFVASGHYIRQRRELSLVTFQFEQRLYRGKDSEKDQSYFLYTMTPQFLSRTLFPLGDMTKPEVRRMADEAGLPYLKKESQDVCFLVENGRIQEHNSYLKKHLPLTPGPIKTLDGRVVGEHQGLPLYTIGQRKGVEIGGTGPYYVARIDCETNTLYVVKDADDPALFNDSFLLRHANWVSGRQPKLPLKTEVVIRYKHKAVPCVLSGGEKGDDPSLTVKLDKPERAVTPGQSAVFYRGNEMLGGGIIK